MEVAQALACLGGVATRAQLIRLTSRREVDQALAVGLVVPVARGRYALASVDEALAAAHARTGVLSHDSAAMRHGWQVRLVPDRPHVTVPPNRVVPGEQRLGVQLHWSPLAQGEAADGVTSVDRTLVDCLRGPFADALCVADSALRDGYSPTHLRALVRDLRGPGSAQARRVADHADGRAANAFESALRAVAIDVPGLQVIPQVPLRSGSRFLGRPDLVDERLGIVIEADSFAWHGDRAALRRDARRYDVLVIHGWLVLRFAWEDVVHDPLWVAEVLAGAVAEREKRCWACERPA